MKVFVDFHFCLYYNGHWLGGQIIQMRNDTLDKAQVEIPAPYSAFLFYSEESPDMRLRPMAER